MAWSIPRTWSVGEVLTAALLNTFLRDNMNAAHPVGELKFIIGESTSAENVINGGWLEANGAAVSRTTYASLFALLNGLAEPLPFGAGDGATTFDLPDLRGRVPVAAGGAHLLGVHDGQATAANRRPEHRTTLIDPGHAHVIEGGGGSGTVVNTGAGGGGASPLTDSASTGITVGTNNGNDALDAPSYLVGGIWIVKF